MSGVISHLNHIRETQGDEAWRKAVTSFIKEGLRRGGKQELFATSMAEGFDFINVAQLKAEIAAEAKQATPTEDAVLQALKTQMPGIKTQAQFNAFMAAFDALRATLNAIFTGDADTATQGRKALDKAFELAEVVSRVSEQLKDVPEAATSKVAEEFRTPPAQFHEYDLHKELTAELQVMGSLKELNVWYGANRDRIDRVMSPSLRNTLFDAIREKRASFKESN